MFSQKSVANFFAKQKKLASHLHHSTQASDEFRALQVGPGPPKEMVNQGLTRWDSKYNAADNFNELDQTIKLFTADHPIVTFTPNEYTLSKNIVILLKPFAMLSKKLQSESAFLSFQSRPDTLDWLP